MIILIHRAADRGHADHGWLQANHSFSFANYFDKDKIRFGALRVLNDDAIAPKMGFGTHPHDNMEIITIPLNGVLKHRDNLHQEWQEVLPGEVQVMSAGTGVAHSEINGTTDEILKLFQIWILPNQRGLSPRYSQKSFDADARKNALQVMVTSMDDHRNDQSLKIAQDARLSRIDLDPNISFDYYLKTANHGVYLMVISGEVLVENETLYARDALGISETSSFNIKASMATEILFIEVPM